MKEWKDVTSYSRDDKERKPTSFEISQSGVRVTITNSHIHYRGKWVMHCFALKMDTVPLKASTLADAKKEALEMAHARACEIFDALADLIEHNGRDTTRASSQGEGQ